MNNILRKSKAEFINLRKSSFNKINQSINQQNVILLHTGRCGSTVLGKTLHQHKKISWEGEIFQPYMNSENNIDNFLDVIKKSRQRKIAPISLFSIKHLKQLHLGEHCLNMDKRELIRSLNKLKGVKFILLERRNYLKRAVSAEVARNKKQWHVKRDDLNSIKKVHIEVNNFQTGHTFQPLLKLFDTMSQSYQNLCEELPEENTLKLTYEDDILEDPKIAYTKICSFLRLNENNAVVDLKKTNPFPLKELITNYKEVNDLLRGSEYEWMLKNS